MTFTSNPNRLKRLDNQLRKLFNQETLDFLFRSVEEIAVVKKDRLLKREKQPSKYLEKHQKIICDKMKVQKELGRIGTGFLEKLDELSQGYANYLLGESIKKNGDVRKEFLEFRKGLRAIGADMTFIYERFRIRYPRISKNTIRTWNHRYKT